MPRAPRVATSVATYRIVDKDGVEFRQETVTGIDPTSRRVTTDAGSYDSDFLVVAMGADYDMDATPGLEAGGFEYYTVAGAERLRDALAAFDGGRVLVSVLGQPSNVLQPRSRGRSCCTSTSASGASASRYR